MKRAICLLLALGLLLTAGTALGSSHCALRANIRAGEQEIPLTMDLYTEPGQMLITTSLLPGTCIRISEPADASLNPMTIWQNLADGKTAETIRTCIQDWITYMQPETRTGVFAGDAFERATAMQRIECSWADLVLLIRKIQKAMKEQGFDAELFGESFAEQFAPEKNIRMELKIFDEGKYASLSVKDRDQIVATVSLNTEEAGKTVIVAGCGTGGKNYYCHLITEEKGDGSAEITEKLYADDRKSGFAGLGENNLILTQQTTIVQTGEKEKAESIRLSSKMIPANGLTPMITEWAIRNAETGRAMEGSFRFEGYDGLAAAVTADLDDEGIGEMPAKIIDLTDAEAIGEIGNTVSGAFMPMLMQILAALPQDYIMPITQMLMN